MASAEPLTIAVLIKQVPDMNAIRVDRANGRIVPSAQLGMSSYDEYAVEAALRLKTSLTARKAHCARARWHYRKVISLLSFHSSRNSYAHCGGYAPWRNSDET